MASTAPAVGMGNKKVRTRDHLRRLGPNPFRASRDGAVRARREAILPAGARLRPRAARVPRRRLTLDRAHASRPSPTAQSCGVCRQAQR